MYIKENYNEYNKIKTGRKISPIPYIRNCSITKQLRELGKSNERFEIMLNNLTLEELIALKLETTTKNLGGKLIALPITEVLKEVLEDAILKFVFSSAKNYTEAHMFLGIEYSKFIKMCKKYGVVKYFKTNDKKIERKKNVDK